MEYKREPVRLIVNWRTLLIVFITVLLTIPPKIYRLPSAIPFDLQLDRLLLIVMFGLWVVTLLVDAEAKVAKTALDGTFAALAAVAVTSFFLNSSLWLAKGALSESFKALFFLASIAGLFYLTVSTITDKRQIDAILWTIVVITSITGFFAIIEHRTGFNVFWHWQQVIPILDFRPYAEMERGGVRVAGSAEHPIAMGALFAMALPLAQGLYENAKTKLTKAGLALGAMLMIVGLVYTASRSSVIGLAVGVGVIAIANIKNTRMLLNYGTFMLAALFATHMLAPGAMGTIRSMFDPQGGLLASEGGMGGRVGRYPAIWRYFTQAPFFGTGFEMFTHTRFFYIDNAYLKLVLEIGALGVLSIAVMFTKLTRRVWEGITAAADDPTRKTLIAMLASCLVFIVVSFFYDTFGFTQTTYLFFILAALSLNLAKEAYSERHEAQRVSA